MGGAYPWLEEIRLKRMVVTDETLELNFLGLLIILRCWCCLPVRALLLMDLLLLPLIAGQR